MKNYQAKFIVVLFLYVQLGYSNTADDIIYLKDGSSIVVQIASVDSFAFYTKNAQSISLKIVDSISTQNESLITELSALYSSVVVIKGSGSTLVSLANIVIPVRIYKERKLWKEFSSTFNYTNEGKKNCEVQFNITPQWSSNFILQVTLSSAMSFKKVQDVSQASIGLGYKYDLQLAEMLLLVNYGEKRVTDNLNPFVQKQTLFGSLYFQKRVDDSNIFFSVGSHIYGINNPAQVNAAKISFIGGIGFMFQ